MNKKVSLGTTVFLCILVGIISFMSAWTITRGSYNNKINELYLQYPEAMKLMEIIDYYESYYIGALDMEETEALAAKGFVHGTGDTYGYYYTPEEYAELIASNNGEYVGIGVMVSYEREDGLLIEHVIPESPAEKAGLKDGDLVIKVADIPAESGIEKMRDAILGEEGSSVDIVVIREGKEITVKAVRGTYVMESVFSGYIEEEKIGFIRIFSFDNTTADQFEKALTELKGKGAESFIFDMRDNGGGLLSSLIDVLECMLPKDSLVTTSTMKNGKTTEYKTKKGTDSFDYPTAILINGNTASAAELFTSALRDYDMAVIVGEKSYGKGVMQSTVELSDGSALKLTTAYYSSPKGENYDGVGIKPNVEAVTEDSSISYYELDMSDAVIKAAIKELSK
ncbi:MAG: S41 family peptidase [Ruminococcaceae bacterium]|nr:S41 family peptidase [Oscillospiraceae bacterium]